MRTVGLAAARGTPHLHWRSASNDPGRGGLKRSSAVVPQGFCPALRAALVTALQPEWALRPLCERKPPVILRNTADRPISRSARELAALTRLSSSTTKNLMRQGLTCACLMRPAGWRSGGARPWKPATVSLSPTAAKPPGPGRHAKRPHRRVMWSRVLVERSLTYFRVNCGAASVPCSHTSRMARRDKVLTRAPRESLAPLPEREQGRG